MKQITRIWSILCLMLMTTVLPATAQNNVNKNKAIIEANDGSREVNTDEISVIRFDGGKITIVQPWGETFFDRTLRSLTFLRANPGTLRLTASTSIGTEGSGNRAQTIDDSGNLKSTWESGDVVYVYPDASTTTNIGTLTPTSYGSNTATLTGNITSTGLTDGQTLYFSTKDRSTFTLSSQDGTVESLFYFTATGTISIVGANASISNLTFSRPIAVVKFALKDKVTGNPAINATKLTVTTGATSIDVTPSSATDVLYVGIPEISGQTVSLTAIVGGIRYVYEKTGVTFLNNKYYAINVKMTNTAIPEGALSGKFTINAGGGKVSFSQGNLQYQASTSTWRFAPNQYDMIGSDNANISDSYTGWIDLLGWGTGNNPTNSSTNNGDYSIFTDWGVNAISNGGNTANMWSTLTKDEWVYLFANHTKGWSNVNDVYGYVIRPDGVSTAVAASYTSSEWAVEESAGSVFLPAACSRGGTTFNPGAWGDYWTSTPYNSNDAYYLYFHQGGQNPSSNSGRFGGRSVRLVYETPFFQGAGTEQDPYRISSEEEWNYLAVKVNSGTNYAGKFFRQTANIDVTTMVGNSSDSKPFSGTYDGDGKTLNLSLNTSTPHTAPFRLIANATIKNVVTTGTVHSTDNHPSGLVGETDGTCTIQNCRVGASVGGAQHSGGIVGHCYHANISIIGCVYSGTLTPASGQWTGGIIGWGGDGGGHTISISDCLFAGTLTGSTKFHPIGILQNQSNTKYLSNTYYTLGAQNTNDDASFVNGLAYKGKFARSITAGTGVTVARTGATAVYDVSGITSYGTGILYNGVLYAGDGEEVSFTLSHGAAPSGYTFSQYTVEGGGSLDAPTSNSPTLTMTDANQTIGAEWIPEGAITFNYIGAVQTFTALATGYYTLECYGAQGGYSSGGLGGKGGLSQLTYQLTKGDVLYIYAGGQGECIDGSSSHPEGGDGGWNGGGKGGTGVQFNGQGTPYNGGGGGGGATHIATSDIGAITGSTDFTSNHAGLLLIAGGGGGGLSWNQNAGGAGGGAEGGKGRHNGEWNITWNNGTLSCGRDGMTSSTGGGSCEGCGGGGGGYQGGNTWTVTYNASNQSYSGAGGSSWGDTTNGKGYSTTTGGATDGGNGKAVITWYGTTYPTE